MEPKLHRRVQRYGLDMAVQDYDRYFVPLLRHCSERCLDLAALQPGERVLDVATGTGVAAFLAAERVGPSGEVVATDISQKMVEAVRADAESRGVTNIRFERVDAEDIAFPDASFDAVTCVLGLMYPADPQQAINQIYRVLKPGGRAAVCVWGRRERCGWAEIFPIVESRTSSDVCQMFFALGTGSAMADAFRSAGFAEVREERISVPIVFPTAAAAIGAAFIGGPVALAHSRFDDPTRESAYAEYLTSIEMYRQGEAYHVPGEFVAVVGRA